MTTPDFFDEIGNFLKTLLINSSFKYFYYEKNHSLGSPLPVGKFQPRERTAYHPQQRP